MSAYMLQMLLAGRLLPPVNRLHVILCAAARPLAPPNVAEQIALVKQYSNPLIQHIGASNSTHTTAAPSQGA